MHRRTLAATFGAALALPRLAAAQDARPVRLVIPFPPGGANDLVARMILPRLSQLLGQPVQLEHRGGAAGSVAAGLVSRAPPDGQTWILANENLATAEALGALPVRLSEGLAACTVIGTSPFTLTAHPATGFQTLAEMAAAARARPGALGYATNGSGGGGHILGVALQRMGGFTLDHIPYRGGGTALADVVEGLVPLLVLNIPVTLAAIREGRLRPLGISQEGESRALPGAPSLVRAGFPQLDLRTWWAVLGPAGLPAAMLARMQRAVEGALAEVGSRLVEIGIDPLGSPPEAARAFLAEDVARWGRLVTDHGITTAS